MLYVSLNKYLYTASAGFIALKIHLQMAEFLYTPVPSHKRWVHALFSCEKVQLLILY